MADGWIFAAFAFGAAAGGTIAWALARGRAAAALSEAHARRQAAEGQLATATQRAVDADAERRRAADALLAEAARRAAAEQAAGRVAALEARLAEAQQELARARALHAELETRLAGERRAAAEKLALLDDARRALGESFSALSAEALRANGQAFLTLASESFQRLREGAQGDLDGRRQAIEAVLKPLAETAVKLDAKLSEVEQARAAQTGQLTEQLRQLGESNLRLQASTAHLVDALRRPAVRGQWGEMQLRRVVELAGMVEHCDFSSQPVVDGADGRQRPDLVVRLPGGKHVVIDAKAVLGAYLEAVEARDEDSRRERLRAHARQLAVHVDQLAAKSYWQQFDPAPEFVVLFIPGEGVLAAAAEQDPALLDYAASQRVVIATPTTLIALLRAVHYGWRQEQVARNAQQVAALGRELHERLRVLAGHFVDLRRALDRSVEVYNKAVGSLEARVLPAARRFRSLGAAGDDEIPELALSDAATRPVSLPEPDAPGATVTLFPGIARAEGDDRGR